MKNPALKLLIILFLACWLAEIAYCQSSSETNTIRRKLHRTEMSIDTSKKKVKLSGISAGGFFLSAGGGLSIPIGNFTNNSNVSFGTLGRLEFSSTSIFPFVIGGEVNYFSYSGDDLFKTTNLLGTFKTGILSFGPTVEYCLTQFLNSAYTVLFITVDAKYNLISREYDDDSNLPEYPRSESKVSYGAGIGFTVFIFDFYAKYNYMKELSNIGVYTKFKIPVIRF